MNKLYIVTGNKDKFQKARENLEPLGIEIEQLVLNIIEPQEEDIIKVALAKVQQAFEQVNKPVIISDTGWSIPALKGFPGPFMHYISEWFTADDFLNLLKTKSDRTIIMQNVVAFYDGKTTKTFETIRNGILLEEPKGEGIPVDQLTTFREDKKTIAECKKLGIKSFDDKKDSQSAWKSFGEWYIKRTL